MSAYFADYLKTLSSQEQISEVESTRDKFQEAVLDSYDFSSDHQVLLYGDVQSGKTSHMLGIVSHCLDEQFQVIVILTSDNVRLVQQTYERAFMSISGVQVCNSGMTNEFRMNQARPIPDPSIVVVGKNSTNLETWLQTFSKNGNSALSGNPILIVDDEADAGSLNTKVNKQDISKINSHLKTLRDRAIGCVYLQVTATPQAVLLQSEESEWVVDGAIHFKPGAGYVGGDFFFGQDQSGSTKIFGETKLSEDVNLKFAVLTHMLTSAIFKIEGRPLCNMMIHPSHRQPVHYSYSDAAQEIVTSTYCTFVEEETQTQLRAVYDDLSKTYKSIPSFDATKSVLQNMENEFCHYIVNGGHKSSEGDWAEGYNILTGGNSLGRGLTFDFLQTVFYVRESERPQADTVWQHARMFGYKRHRPTLRLFLPSTLAKMFSEVHQGNEVIKRQLEKGVDVAKLRVVLNGGISPTRANVLDKSKVRTLTGGVNYFAGDPENPDFDALDKKLDELTQRSGDDFELNMRATAELTNFIKCDQLDLDLQTFRVALEEYRTNSPGLMARVVVRRGRRVSHGKGTLLSPTDQELSKLELNRPLLILYRISGVNEKSAEEGGTTWKSDPIWVPNIMIPDQRQFLRVDN